MDTANNLLWYKEQNLEDMTVSPYDSAPSVSSSQWSLLVYESCIIVAGCCIAGVLPLYLRYKRDKYEKLAAEEICIKMNRKDKFSGHIGKTLVYLSYCTTEKR